MASADRPIRVAAHLQLQHADYDVIRRAALEAEGIGVDAVFNYDHFFPLSGDPNGKGLPSWPEVGEKTATTMQIGDTTEAIPVAGTPAKLAFWQQYYSRPRPPQPALIMPASR